MDMDRHARRLQEAQRELERHVRPVRERVDRLGVAGLYALAALEQREADLATDAAARSVHTAASLAAQALGDRAVERACPGLI